VRYVPRSDPLLNTSIESAQAELLKPLDARLMRCYPVSERVNRVENDDPECAREVAPKSAIAPTLF